MTSHVISEMAERALQKLEEQLNCSVCLDTYTDPKTLHCHHIYCRACLVRLVVRDDQGQLVLTCPACRQVTPVPANGVAGLQSAFNITPFLEIQDSFKRIAIKELVPLEGAVGGEASDTPVSKNCLEHAEELKLYCETCGELVCFHCVIKGCKHHSHDYELLDKAFEKYKGEVTSSLEPMEKQLTTIKKALAQLDSRCEEISEQREVTEASIHGTFRKIQETLDVRKTSLINQLHQITQQKLKSLAVQRDQIETTLAQLSSCFDFMKESLTTGNEREVLKMKTTIVRQVKELTTTFQPDILKPNTEADIVFSTSADVISMCQDYGQIYTSGSPDSSKCHVTGKGVEVAMVATAVLQAVSFKGHACEEPIGLLEGELVSEITGTRARGSIERRGQSQYEISYQPTIQGRHQLHIKVEGQHVRGSPFDVAVNMPVEKLGTPMLAIHEVNIPRDVAVNQRGEVVVAGECISVFSPTGKKLRTFPAPEEAKYTRAVTVDGEGNILVVGVRVPGIHKYTSDGTYLTSGPRTKDLDSILAIAYNSRNNKVYATSNKSCVYILNSNLTISSTFGSGKGQFDSPYGIACDSTGDVYVADSGNNRIQVFSAEGKFLKMFWRGEGGRELCWPAGVVVDSNGVVYVSEDGSDGNNRVSVFTSEGQFVTSFGSGVGQFWGLAVDGNGRLFVCDRWQNCVQVFLIPLNFTI